MIDPTIPVKVLTVNAQEQFPVPDMETLSLNNIRGEMCTNAPVSLNAGLRNGDIDVVVCSYSYLLLEQSKELPMALSVLDFIRNHENQEFRKIPIIVVTGIEEIAKIIEIYEMGADMVLNKYLSRRGTPNNFLCTKIKALVRMKRRLTE